MIGDDDDDDSHDDDDDDEVVVVDDDDDDDSYDDDDDDDDDYGDDDSLHTLQVPSVTFLAWSRWGPDAKVLFLFNCRQKAVFVVVTTTICRRRGDVAASGEGKYRLQSGTVTD